MKQNITDPSANISVVRNKENDGQIVVHDPYVNAYVPDKRIDLREAWNIITKHKGLILFIFLLSLITTTFATLMMRPIYRAEALIEIKPDRKSVVDFQNLEQAQVQPSEYKTTQQNILQSASVAEAVIAKLKLENEPEINGTLKQASVIGGIKELISSKTTDQEEAKPDDAQAHIRRVGRFQKRLSVEPIKKSDLFKVSFESFSPEMAADIANASIAEYIRFDRERTLGSTSDERNFLTHEIVPIQKKLGASEKALTAFARKHKIIDGEAKGDDIMIKSLSDLTSQVVLVTGERIAAEALWIQSKSRSGIEALPSVLDSGLINELKKTHATLQSEYFKLSKIYKPAHPALQQVKAQLDDVKSTMDSEIGRIVEGLKRNYEQLLNKEQLLSEKVEQQKQELLATKDKTTQYNILKRQWETDKEFYISMRARMKEVGVAGGLEANNIAVIDSAKIPIAPYKPNLTFNMLVASALGLLGGIGLSFFISYLDNTVRTPEDLEKATAVTSLGLIPKEKLSRFNGKTAHAKNTKEASAVQQAVELRSFFLRNSELSEAFRSLRTSLIFSSPQGLPKIIQVTSTIPGEGKTTIATNLALVLAANGAKVLLADADLRKQRIHKVFSIPRIPGMTETILGDLKADYSNEWAVNFSVLSAGTTPRNPAELLGSQSMDTFLDRLSEEYDHIILDSAPLLGLADSVILSTKVDGVVYTVHSGVITKDKLREGIMRLRRVRAPLLGAVLNNVDLRSKEFSGYGQYYYNRDDKDSFDVA